MNFITINQLNSDIVNNLSIIPKNIDIVVGIPRSGMLPATLIALYLNKPLASLDSFLQKIIYSVGDTKNISEIKQNFQEIKTALIVDDSLASGKAMIKAKRRIKDSKISQIHCFFLAVYVTHTSKSLVDQYFRIVETPRLFEWNYMHHSMLKVACVDLDGVLCIDPTEQENDDGNRYRSFILNAKTKYIPTQQIGWIVTSRLAKYRKETEQWVTANNIQYGTLIMMPESYAKSAKERQEKGNHALFKASVYKNIDASMLFIESNMNQAKEINALTNKAVICVDNLHFMDMSYAKSLKFLLSEKLYYVVRNAAKLILPENAYESVKRFVKTRKNSILDRKMKNKLQKWEGGGDNSVEYNSTVLSLRCKPSLYTRSIAA